MDKREMVADVNEDAIVFDDLDEAIIGMAERAGSVSVAIYDYEKCVEIFMKNDGMSREDAIEWMEFNVVSAYVGEHTPMFLHPFEEETTPIDLEEIVSNFPKEFLAIPVYDGVTGEEITHLEMFTRLHKGLEKMQCKPTDANVEKAK